MLRQSSANLNRHAGGMDYGAALLDKSAALLARAEGMLDKSTAVLIWKAAVLARWTTERATMT